MTTYDHKTIRYTEGPLVILGRQYKTEIGSFYAIGPAGRPCTAYAATPDDAKLYAAAPDMLEALQALASAYESAILGEGYDPEHSSCSVLDEANAAIAKAAT